jgi:hypothetical protein
MPSRLTERLTTSCGELILSSMCDSVLIIHSEMAAKEASQRHVIEQQFVQIADLQRANLKLRGELADGVSRCEVFEPGHRSRRHSHPVLSGHSRSSRSFDSSAAI